MANAAEWKSEPGLSISTQYSDNVRMQLDSSNPENSTGYILEPRLKLKAEEQYAWDMSLDARGRVIRHQDVEDADSDDIFFDFDTGRKTEVTEWRLNTSFRRNSNFDTDYETQNLDGGVLLDDHTEEKTVNISPSVIWKSSEISQVSFLLSSSDVSYDEVTNLNYRNYDYDSARFSAYWLMGENHQFGFTGTYAEYDSPAAEFSYDQTVFQLDYTYKLSPVSDIALSFGGRRIDSVAENVTVGCEIGNTIVDVSEVSSTGECPEVFIIFPVTPVVEDVRGVDDGTVVDFTYKHNSETTAHSLKAGKTVIPSSFGRAQERVNLTYQLSVKNTERLTTKLIINAYETETLNGGVGTTDRKNFQFEPFISYELNRNWNINFRYRYQQQEFANEDEDRVANSLYISLYLHWPKLASTY